jgi:hypothetical protein
MCQLGEYSIYCGWMREEIFWIMTENQISAKYRLIENIQLIGIYYLNFAPKLPFATIAMNFPSLTSGDDCCFKIQVYSFF